MAILQSCTSGCGCNSCGCNGCATVRSTGCGCNNCGCNTARSTACGCNTCGCATVRSNCNCFGVLRNIAGPVSRCGSCNCNFPFFTGPCGPCNSCTSCGCNTCGCNNCGCTTTRSTGCGCNDCCDDCCDNCCNDCCCDDCCCHAGATFAANTPVELAEGDAVVLSPTFESPGEFASTREGIEILQSGTYLILYTVHIPANHAVSSRFVLTLNGERIAASAMDVATEGDCTTNGFTMHAMVNAQAGSLLKLVALNPVSICPSSASNVFTLSITRLH